MKIQWSKLSEEEKKNLIGETFGIEGVFLTEDGPIKFPRLTLDLLAGICKKETLDWKVEGVHVFEERELHLVFRASVNDADMTKGFECEAETTINAILPDFERGEG